MANTIENGESMAAMQMAMTKRAQTQEGQQILSLISGAASTAQSANNAVAATPAADTLATDGSLGTHINLHV